MELREVSHHIITNFESFLNTICLDVLSCWLWFDMKNFLSFDLVGGFQAGRYRWTVTSVPMHAVHFFVYSLYESFTLNELQRMHVFCLYIHAVLEVHVHCYTYFNVSWFNTFINIIMHGYDLFTAFNTFPWIRLHFLFNYYFHHHKYSLIY